MKEMFLAIKDRTTPSKYDNVVIGQLEPVAKGTYYFQFISGSDQAKFYMDIGYDVYRFELGAKVESAEVLLKMEEKS